MKNTRNKSFRMISDWFIYFGAFLDRENRYMSLSSSFLKWPPASLLEATICGKAHSPTESLWKTQPTRTPFNWIVCALLVSLNGDVKDHYHLGSTCLRKQWVPFKERRVTTVEKTKQTVLIDDRKSILSCFSLEITPQDHAHDFILDQNELVLQIW